MIFKHRVKVNKLYLRMLVMLIAVIEIAILSVSATLFINMKKNMLNQLYVIYVEDIKKSIKDTQATIDMINSTSIQIRYDYYVKLLCSYNEPDATQYLPALQQMTNYRRAVKDINSIYVYNSDTFYISDESAPNLIQSKKEFSDKGIVSIVNNYKMYDTFKPIPRKITDLNTGEESEGYTFLLYDKVPLGSNSMVIINLKDEWLKRTLQQMKQVGSTKDLIIDDKGSVIASDGKEKFLSTLSETYIHKVIAKSTTSGYIIDDVNKEKSLITYTKIPSLKWNYISVIPYKVVGESISGILVKVLIICAIILLLGIGAAIYLSRKLYDPVESLLNKLKLYETQQDNISSENRKRFLLNFIWHSKQMEESFIKKGFEEYGIKLSLTSAYILCLVQVDKWSIISENMKDKDLIKFAICNITKDILLSQSSTEMIDIDEDKILFIININMDNDYNKESITKEVNYIQKLINDYFQISVSMTISKKNIGFKDLQKTLEALKEGAKNRFFYGYGSVMFHEDIEKSSKIKYTYQEHKTRDIISSLTTGKNAKAKEMYLEVINELKKSTYATFQIYTTFLFWEISQAIKNVKASLNNNLSERLEAFTSEMVNIETLDTFNEVVFQIFDSIDESFKNVSSLKYENITKDIMTIINTRYNDINLSVEGISDNIGFTAPYITKIFKQYTGKTIIEYINEKRIERAKMLLIETTDNVSIISEKCGFANQTYFYRAFKKTVGTTPNLYRCTSGK